MALRQLRVKRFKNEPNYSPHPSYPGYHVIKQPARQPRAKSFLNYTLILIIINVIFFLAVLFLIPILGEEKWALFFRNDIALTPATFLQHPWTLITSMFMHAPSLFSSHLFVNMLSLLFLGSFLEKVIGSRRFIKLYFAGGIAGSLMLLLLFTLSNDPRVVSLSFFANAGAKTAAEISAVGASAAIFALAGCLAILIPKIPVLVFFILPMKLWQAIIFLMAALSIIPGVANSAHLGGLLVGIFYALYLKKKYGKKVVMLNRMLGLG